MYDTGLVSGEDCTTIGGRGSTFLRAGVERGYPPDDNCAGGDLRWRVLYSGGVFSNRSICYGGLPERQGCHHRASKDNNYSSHVLPFH